MKRKRYRVGGPIDSLPLTQPRPLPNPNIVVPPTDFTGLGPTTYYRPATIQPRVSRPNYTPDSSHSKSKDRFREHKTGGFLSDLGAIASFINPAVGIATTGLGLVTNIIESMNQKNKIISASPGNYATGGHLTKAKAREILHDGSVRGHKLTDKQRRFFGAHAYNTGGQMDVPLADNSFQVKGNPSQTDANYYPQFNSYLDHNEVVKNDFVFSDSIRSPLTGAKFSEDALKLEKSTKNAQRKLKLNPTDEHAQNTVMHNEKSSAALAALQETLATKMGLRNNQPPMHLQHGGPTDPQYPWLDWTTWKPQSIPPAQGTIPASSIYQPVVTNNAPSLGSGHGVISQPPPYYKGSDTQLPPAIQSTPPPSSPQARKPRRATAPLSTKPIEPIGGPLATGPLDLPFDTIPYQRTPEVPFDNAPGVTSQQRANGIPLPGAASSASTSSTDAMSAPGGASDKQPLAFGDYLQLGSLVGEILPLFGGPEKEKANLDSTFITKEHFDVRQALQQNQRNFSNVASSINTPSETLRRALLSQLDATKSNRDNQVLAQYQTLNNQAQTRYEDRLSNQRRYNIGQQTYTNDANARNRASYRYAVQNAFESLSNLGMAFNQRDYQQKQLNLLKGRYGDVYANVIANLLGNAN